MARDLDPAIELPLPMGMPRLRVHDGRPVLWHVPWDDAGVPQLRAIDESKWARAVLKADPLCWTCGGRFTSKLGYLQTYAFLVPLGATRLLAVKEPPSHRECAEWVQRNDPTRRATAVWLCTRYRLRADGLIELGPGGCRRA